MRIRSLRLASTTVGLALVMGSAGCVTTSHYNQMLAQQQALEASLRSEIGADQVKIEQLEDGIRVRMSGDLLYRSGAVDLTPAGRSALDKVAAQLATQPDEIDVVGNTDNERIGPELRDRYPSNWELAGERASIVVRHLQSKGVNPGQMRAISAGEYHPVAPNDTAAGRAQNRRTDLLLRPPK